MVAERLAGPLRPLCPVLKAAYTAGHPAVAPATVRLSQRRGGWLPTGVAWTMDEAAAADRRPPVGGPPRGSAPPALPDGRAEPPPRVRRHRPRRSCRASASLELDGGRVLSTACCGHHGRRPASCAEMSWYFGTTRPREHPMFLHPFPPAAPQVPGRLGVLASRGDASNYYHFLHDCLPRLGVLEQCPEVAPPDRWYVPGARRSSGSCSTSWASARRPDHRRREIPHVRAEHARRARAAERRGAQPAVGHRLPPRPAQAGRRRSDPGSAHLPAPPGQPPQPQVATRTR